MITSKLQLLLESSQDLKRDMINFLRKEYTKYYDKDKALLENDINAAIYWYTEHYTKDFNSDGYRLHLSLKYKPYNKKSVEDEEKMIIDMYGSLTEKFGEQI